MIFIVSLSLQNLALSYSLQKRRRQYLCKDLGFKGSIRIAIVTVLKKLEVFKFCNYLVEIVVI